MLPGVLNNDPLHCMKYHTVDKTFGLFNPLHSLKSVEMCLASGNLQTSHTFYQRNVVCNRQ